MPPWRWRLAQVAERLWWRRYLRSQDPVAYLAWKRDYWRTFIYRLGLAASLPPERQYGLRVLDAGCGPAGIFTVYPLASVTAVDTLLTSYEDLPVFARTRYPNVHWVASSLEAYRPTERFDLVFCLNVLNHVCDLDGVLRVLAKALSPNGTLVLSVDAHRYRLLKPVFRTIPGDVLHPHQMDLLEYEAAFAKTGFAIVERLRYRREAIFDYWVVTLRHAPVGT